MGEPIKYHPNSATIDSFHQWYPKKPVLLSWNEKDYVTRTPTTCSNDRNLRAVSYLDRRSLSFERSSEFHGLTVDFQYFSCSFVFWGITEHLSPLVMVCYDLCRNGYPVVMCWRCLYMGGYFYLSFWHSMSSVLYNPYYFSHLVTLVTPYLDKPRTSASFLHFISNSRASCRTIAFSCIETLEPRDLA